MILKRVREWMDQRGSLSRVELVPDRVWISSRARIVHRLSLDDPLLRFVGGDSIQGLLERLERNTEV